MSVANNYEDVTRSRVQVQTRCIVRTINSNSKRIQGRKNAYCIHSWSPGFAGWSEQSEGFVNTQDKSIRHAAWRYLIARTEGATFPCHAWADGSFSNSAENNFASSSGRLTSSGCLPSGTTTSLLASRKAFCSSGWTCNTVDSFVFRSSCCPSLCLSNDLSRANLASLCSCSKSAFCF